MKRAMHQSGKITHMAYGQQPPRAAKLGFKILGLLKHKWHLIQGQSAWQRHPRKFNETCQIPFSSEVYKNKGNYELLQQRKKLSTEKILYQIHLEDKCFHGANFLVGHFYSSSTVWLYANTNTWQ